MICSALLRHLSVCILYSNTDFLLISFFAFLVPFRRANPGLNSALLSDSNFLFLFFLFQKCIYIFNFFTFVDYFPNDSKFRHEYIISHTHTVDSLSRLSTIWFPYSLSWYSSVIMSRHGNSIFHLHSSIDYKFSALYSCFKLIAIFNISPQSSALLLLILLSDLLSKSPTKIVSWILLLFSIIFHKLLKKISLPCTIEY
jgi:hypothetical protein